MAPIRGTINLALAVGKGVVFNQMSSALFPLEIFLPLNFETITFITHTIPTKCASPKEKDYGYELFKNKMHFIYLCFPVM